ncbi:NAD(P)-binding protein [Vararia minispora EC-137]|uniref:NAD(P)-binding protein n=1 Tax=Vararia minispora EC-137 TaxID=1314806 RepID=A0ACB8QE07_9AGAM|nr:NAD(P)-binding protein [Vararia minispora EC-137]
MGNLLSVVAQMFPPKPMWGVNDIPNLSGKVIIVTGGNTGVGKETVKPLLARGAKVYIAARNEAKTKSAIEDLKKETGKEAVSLHLDLADLVSVKAAAKEFLSKENRLDILFNNAAVMACPVDELTKQGFDMQIGTNVLGHYHFTQLLLPALKAVHANSPQEKARVVITSASAVYLTTLDLGVFEDTPKRRNLSPMELYIQSKHANVIHARELARRYGDDIVTTSVNPGNLRTELQRYLVGVQKFVISQILHPAPLGALTQLYAGTAPEAADLNGKFLIPWARVGVARKEALDPQNGEKLWNWLESHSQNI